MPTDAALAPLDAAIAKRPEVDTLRLTEALQALCAARDDTADPARREHLCLLIALVMAVKHPIATPPWEALLQARRTQPRFVSLPGSAARITE